MGLRAPFGYVGYEVTFGRFIIKILDELCSHCHTDRDYQNGCRSCPAGQMLYECREYLLYYEESDKKFELYASDEWAQRRIKNNMKPPTEEQRKKELEMAADYKPECDILRAMKPLLKRIKPKPFYFVKDRSRKNHVRPKVLQDFATLLEDYARLRKERMVDKWGLPEL